MAYSLSNPPFVVSQGIISGKNWRYESNDSSTTVGAAGYFSNGYALGMRAGDTITVIDLADSYRTTIHTVSSSSSVVEISYGSEVSPHSGTGAALTVPNIKGLDGLEIPEVAATQRVSILVLGMYAQGDDGSRFVYWDASASKASHNGGTIIAPEAITAWDGTGADIATLLDWTGTGLGCFIAVDQTRYIEDFGASTTITINDVVLNHMAGLSLATIKSKATGSYPVYQFSDVIDFNNRPFDLSMVTLKPINAIGLANGTVLIKTGTTTTSILTSRYCSIKIDGNAGSISGGTSNATNQAAGYVALNVYGDRSPKGKYYIDLSNCSYGLLVNGDCECKSFEVHSSYVDYLIDEREADQSYWRVFGKYSGQVFKSDGQSSGYLFLMWEQTVALAAAPATPCIDIAGGKSYSIGGELRAINTSVVINDSPTGGNGTGHINFDDLQIIQARTNLAMQIKNVDVVSGSFYLENYTVGGVVLDDIRCAAGLTMNLSDCRGGVPLTINDLGTALGFNSKISVNISRSTGGTPSTNAIEITNTYNCTLDVGQCSGNISVGSSVTGVHIDLDADFVRNSKSITVANPVGHLTARVGGVVTLAWLDERVASWAFDGLQFVSVYRDSTFSSPMYWNRTGFVAGNTLVSNSAQLAVANDLYKINNLMKVKGAAVYLADVNKPVYPAGTDPDDNWVDSAGANVITGIDTAELKYACTFSGPVSYDLATDRFTASRPSSGTSGQLIYAVANGSYAVEINNISGGTLAIRDDSTVVDTVAAGVSATRTVAITTGELRINNQFYPYDTVFQVLSILPA